MFFFNFQRSYREISSPSNTTNPGQQAAVLSSPSQTLSDSQYLALALQQQQQQLLKQADPTMLSTAATLTNGTSNACSLSSCSPTPTTTNGDSDAKKVRLDGSVSPPLSAGTSVSNSPSKVLHFRNVPSEASESEVIYLGLPFGVPSNVLLNKKGHQAFLEMPDEEASKRCVDYYGSNPKQALIRGQPVIYATF